MKNPIIGHDRVGTGSHGVLVMNDWLCDCSTWDDARKYLDTSTFSWAFTDLRGYGRSVAIGGEHTVREAADDVLGLADDLGWKTFSVIGHSMSSLIALHLAQQSGRVDSAIVMCPPPPSGFGVNDEILASMRELSLGDDQARRANLEMRWGNRLGEGWITHKLERWRATSDAAAVADYSVMFGRDGMPDSASLITVPVLAVTGEQDWEMMRSSVVAGFLSPLCEHLEVVPLADAGHYPMQEMPPLLVATIERFLNQPLA